MADDLRRHEAAQEWDDARYLLAEITLMISHAKQDREKVWHEMMLELPDVLEDGRKMTVPMKEATIFLDPRYQELSKKIRHMEEIQLKMRKNDWEAQRAFEHEENMLFHNVAIERSERMTPQT